STAERSAVVVPRVRIGCGPGATDRRRVRVAASRLNRVGRRFGLAGAAADRVCYAVVVLFLTGAAGTGHDLFGPHLRTQLFYVVSAFAALDACGLFLHAGIY